MKGLKTATIVFVILLAFVAASHSFTIDDRQPDQVQQLQAEVQRLNTEMDNVKHVQGYVAWEQEWKRYKEWQVTHP